MTPERLPIFFFFSSATAVVLPKKLSSSRKSKDGFVAVDVFVGTGGGGLLFLEGDVLRWDDAVLSLLLPSPERSGNEEDDFTSSFENVEEGFENVAEGFENVEEGAFARYDTSISFEGGGGGGALRIW